jgi:HlyD family secretion protein
MMKRPVLRLALALLCIVAAWFVWHEASRRGWLGHSQTGTELQTGQAGKSAGTQPGQETVVGMGRIEPAGGVIDVGAMMGDRLGQLLVKEGDQVEKGARLAELESHELRSLELEAATVQFQQAEGRLAIETQLADLKIKTAELGVQKAEAAELNLKTQERKTGLLEGNLILAKKDQERLGKLSKDLVADQERERQALLVRQAESELESARATLDQLRDANRLGLEAANLDLIAAKEAKKQLPFVIPVRSLEVSRKLAEAQFHRTEVTAPCNGTILNIYARPGETLGNKPILQVGDLQKMVVVTEVYENEVKYLRLGQKASVASRAFPSPYDQQGLPGQVTRIGRMINSPMLRSVDPFAPADRHVVEVRVELDDEGSRQTATLTNLQVDVRFPKEGGARKAEGGGD